MCVQKRCCEVQSERDKLQGALKERDERCAALKERSRSKGTVLEQVWQSSNYSSFGKIIPNCVPGIMCIDGDSHMSLMHHDACSAYFWYQNNSR